MVIKEIMHESQIEEKTLKKEVEMKALLVILLLFSNFVIADTEKAPPNFDIGDKKGVWVDFQSAEYQIIYDTSIERASVASTISFIQKEDGYPLFDSVANPLKILVNGEKTSAVEVPTPNGETKVRLISKFLKAGHHTMSLTSNIENGVKFSTPKKNKNYKRVSSGFFIRDLTDRMFLEKYLPTNLEFDHYKIRMDVKVLGTKRWHSLFANGAVTKLTENHYQIDFPKHYTSSSVYFHLIPINKFVRWYFRYKTSDGRRIPVTIYSRNRVYNFLLKRKALKVLRELERDYGAWPHDQLIIYGTGLRGGMEHAGATETSLVALGHELLHCYFAKGVQPADGNSGWMDEAIASWRDKGYPSFEKPFFDSSNLGNHTVYTRKTDKRSYEYGRSFMGYLDYQLKDAGHDGLKDFLRIFFHKRKYTNVTTSEFMADLEEYSNMSFADDFRQYIYGQTQALSKAYLKTHEHNDVKENPYHPRTSRQELDSIL
jgi:hypothetical protein